LVRQEAASSGLVSIAPRTGTHPASSKPSLRNPGLLHMAAICKPTSEARVHRYESLQRAVPTSHPSALSQSAAMCSCPPS
jgi:hypothetical protein